MSLYYFRTAWVCPRCHMVIDMAVSNKIFNRPNTLTQRIGVVIVAVCLALLVLFGLWRLMRVPSVPPELAETATQPSIALCVQEKLAVLNPAETSG
jgi:hypothetical protein